MQITRGQNTIGYRDGAEAYLLRFFSEHSVDEYELYPRDAPWAIRYHLTLTAFSTQRDANP